MEGNVTLGELKGMMKGKPKLNPKFSQKAFSGKELKFFDTTLGFTFDATAEVPATGQLCLITPGTGDSQYVGNKCVVKSIQIKGACRYEPGASTAGADIVEFAVVWDKQCNAAAAGIVDVLTGSSMNTSMVNLDNAERFVILKRFTIDLNSFAGVSGAYSTRSVPVDWYHKCNIPLYFRASTGTVADLTSNNLFLIAGTRFGVDDATSFQGTCRLRFSDD